MWLLICLIIRYTIHPPSFSILVVLDPTMRKTWDMLKPKEIKCLQMVVVVVVDVHVIYACEDSSD